MTMKTTLLAAAAIAALATPAFAQTLSTSPTSASSAVVTTIAPACAITGSLSTFTLAINPQGVVTTAAPTQSMTVTCNTPDGNLALGSNDMVNSTAPAIVETAVFTNRINFIGFADGILNGDGWALDTRASSSLAGAATIGFNSNVRVRPLTFSIGEVAPADAKLPVAGVYTGTICLTVSPVGPLTGIQMTNTDNSCGAVTL